MNTVFIYSTSTIATLKSAKRSVLDRKWQRRYIFCCTSFLIFWDFKASTKSRPRRVPVKLHELLLQAGKRLINTGCLRGLLCFTFQFTVWWWRLQALNEKKRFTTKKEEKWLTWLVKKYLRCIERRCFIPGASVLSPDLGKQEAEPYKRFWTSHSLLVIKGVVRQ